MHSMTESFSLAVTPQLYFGQGKITLLPSLVKGFGRNVLLVTGARSFDDTFGVQVLDAFDAHNLSVGRVIIDREPEPAMIDDAVVQYQGGPPDVVIAVGGGSVLDAGKAVSAMLRMSGSVRDYLEGVGTRSPGGAKIPFIAVPTTAGTGSEATKNAVLSEVGHHGFKKSLRHDKYVPDVAVVDPELTVHCPPTVTASGGMDAFTQLLESYLSTAANPVTDALAMEGLLRVSRSLLKAYHHGDDVDARADMALAAFLSGITLANAGLGVVHGFASSVGGYYPVPHGVICSRMMFPSNMVTVRRLRKEGTRDALTKYASAGRMFCEKRDMSDDYYIDAFLGLIQRWTTEMKIPTLSQAGVEKHAVGRIVSITDSKFNPAKLGNEELTEILEMAL
jgi:alcohol dehydrogenase class IV